MIDEFCLTYWHDGRWHFRDKPAQFSVEAGSRLNLVYLVKSAQVVDARAELRHAIMLQPSGFPKPMPMGAPDYSKPAIPLDTGVNYTVSDNPVDPSQILTGSYILTIATPTWGAVEGASVFARIMFGTTAEMSESNLATAKLNQEISRPQ